MSAPNEKPDAFPPGGAQTYVPPTSPQRAKEPAEDNLPRVQIRTDTPSSPGMTGALPFAPQAMGAPAAAPPGHPGGQFAPQVMGAVGTTTTPFAPQMMGGPPGHPGGQFAPQVMGAAPFAPQAMGAPPGHPGGQFAPQVMGAVGTTTTPFAPQAMGAPPGHPGGQFAPQVMGAVGSTTTPFAPQMMGAQPAMAPPAQAVSPFAAQAMAAPAPAAPSPWAPQEASPAVAPQAPPPGAAPADASLMAGGAAAAADELAASPWNTANNLGLNRSLLPSATAASEPVASPTQAARSEPVAEGPSRGPWIVVGALVVIAVAGVVAVVQLSKRHGGDMAIPTGSAAPDDTPADTSSAAPATSASAAAPVHRFQPRPRPVVDDPYADVPATPHPAPKPTVTAAPHRLFGTEN